MAEKSIFREFIAALRKRWKEQVQFIQPLTEARGHLPKASTFYAGSIPRSSQHVFFYFQHSNKAWHVGRFTINVVLAADANNPRMASGTRTGSDFSDGYYRIGFLVGKKDKWWHLKADKVSILTEAWRPSSYDDSQVVLREAVSDVTQDVLLAMRLLGVAESHKPEAESGGVANPAPPHR
jgi:hypothetical protein